MNIMDSRIDNNSMFKLPCKSRTQKDPQRVSELVSYGMITESACYKVSWQLSVMYIHLLFALSFFSQESQLSILQKRKSSLNFLQEKKKTHIKTFPILGICFFFKSQIKLSFPLTPFREE